MTNRLEELKKGARENILYCKTDARSVLLSLPAQHRCDKCSQLWVVGDQPPVCRMFNTEKYADWLTTHIYTQAIQDAIGALPEIVEVAEAGYEVPEDSLIAADQARNYTIEEAHKRLQALLPQQ